MSDYVPLTLEQLFDAFAREIEAGIAHQTRPRGGQQVTPSGDFVYCSPSALGRLEWWLREFRAADVQEQGAEIDRLRGAVDRAFRCCGGNDAQVQDHTADCDRLALHNSESWRDLNLACARLRALLERAAGYFDILATAPKRSIDWAGVKSASTAMLADIRKELGK